MSGAYAVCSMLRKKPVTRALCQSKREAIELMDRLRTQADSDVDFWIAELGPHVDGWRWLGADEE